MEDEGKRNEGGKVLNENEFYLYFVMCKTLSIVGLSHLRSTIFNVSTDPPNRTVGKRREVFI